MADLNGIERAGYELRTGMTERHEVARIDRSVGSTPLLASATCVSTELRHRCKAHDALVTGGTGFIGANIVRELVAAGATVRVLARRGSDRRALEGVRVEFAEGDLLDRGSSGARGGGRATPSTTWPPTTGCGRRTPQ